MAMVEIPIDAGLYAWSQEVQLDGSLYSLAFRWSVRAQAWYWSLFDANGNAIVTGRRFVVDWPLLRTVSLTNSPPGQFYAFNTTTPGQDPGLKDMGDAVKLFYAEYGTDLSALT